LQCQVLTRLIQTNRCCVATRVPMNVGQTFLNNTKKVCLHFLWQAFNLLRSHQVYFNATTLGKSFDVPLQSRHESCLIQHGGMQAIGKCTNFQQ